MHNLDDFVEFTKKKRQEHMMRGFEPEDLLEEPDSPLTRYDLAPFFYPADEDIERVGVRGIYLSNYVPWNAREHTEFVIKELGFSWLGLATGRSISTARPTIFTRTVCTII